MKGNTFTVALLLASGALLWQSASAQTSQPTNSKGTERKGDQKPKYEQQTEKSQSQDTTGKRSNETQSQGNSAGGTSAWPQATGTTGAITPESQTPVTRDGSTDTTRKSGKEPKSRRKGKKDPNE